MKVKSGGGGGNLKNFVQVYDVFLYRCAEYWCVVCNVVEVICMEVELDGTPRCVSEKYVKTGSVHSMVRD